MNKLFSSYKLGSLTLPNRIIKSAMPTCLWLDGKVTDEVINYHKEILEGGVGMTTVFMVANPDRSNQQGACMQCYLHENIKEEFEKLLEEVKPYGKVSIQISNNGSNYSGARGRARESCNFSQRGSRRSSFTTNAKAARLNNNRRNKEPLDEEELISGQILAAKVAYESGFDCIELQYAQGTGIMRNSGSSSCIGERILKGIREEINDDDFPVLVRMNIGDSLKRGVTLEAKANNAKRLVEAGATAIVASRNPKMGGSRSGNSQRRRYFCNGNNMRRRMKNSDGCDLLEAVKYFKEVLGSEKIILSGGMGRFENVEEVFNAGIELIQLGSPSRRFFNDPNFPNKLKNGEVDFDDYQCFYPGFGRNSRACIYDNGYPKRRDNSRRGGMRGDNSIRNSRRRDGSCSRRMDSRRADSRRRDGSCSRRMDSRRMDSRRRDGSCSRRMDSRRMDSRMGMDSRRDDYNCPRRTDSRRRRDPRDDCPRRRR